VNASIRALRAVILPAAILLVAGVVGGCSRGDDAAPGTTKIVFTVESRDSADGAFPPGSDRGKLTAEAAGLLAQRLSDGGIRDPKAVVEGESIVVTARGATKADIVELAAPGVLLMRPVLFTAPADPAASGLDSELRQANPNTPAAEMARRAQQLKCAGKDPLAGGDDPRELLVTCSVDGKTVYSLGPAIIEGTEVESASAVRAASGQWVVTLAFGGKAKELWQRYTSDNVGKQVAFVVDSAVLSAPMIQSAIAGATEISGIFSEGQAKHLATVLKSGALPVRLVPAR